MKKRNGIFTAILVALVLAAAGCGGGGGGGGGGGSAADTTAPSIAFTTPSPSGSLTYNADPTSLPSSLAVAYSDASGVQSSTFSSIFTFRGVSFNLTSLFTAGGSAASASPGVSPLYWTIVSRYNMTSLAESSKFTIFGVSSGSSGSLRFMDSDSMAGMLYVGAASRNVLLFVNLSTGAVSATVQLSGVPSIVRACPAQSKVYVSVDGDPRVWVYNSTTGAQRNVITLDAKPKSMVVNRVSSTLYAIYENSNTLATVSCADDSVTSAALSWLPQRIVTDGLAANAIYYAGGIGADKAIYKRVNGAEQKIAALAELPEDMTFDNSRNLLFLSSYGADTVAVYDSTDGSLEGTVAVGDQPFSLESAAAANKTFCLNKGSDTVSIISNSGRSISSTINLTADPVGLVADTTNGMLYVLQNVWELSTQTTATLSAGVSDNAGNSGGASLNLTIRPVSTGGPSSPNPPPARR